MEFFKRILAARYILVSLVKQDLKNRYRNSIMGIGWSLLTPLGLVLIIGTVYSKVFGQPMKEFIPFLFSGLLTWIFVSQCAEGGTAAFLSAEGYIKQTQTPIEIFPLRITLVSFVNFLYSLGAFYLIYLIISPSMFRPVMLMVIPSIAIWFLLGLGWSIVAGILHVYFRDFGPIQSLFLQAVFYATPIMFPPEILKKGHFEWVYQWNPFYYLIEIIRDPMLGTKVPPFYMWAISFAFVLVLFVVGVSILTKVGRNITFRL